LSRASVLALLILTCGCAVRAARPSRYRLLRQSGKLLLIPPGVSDARMSRRTLSTPATADSDSCTPEPEAIELRLKKQTLKVTVRRAALMNRPAGWLARWGAALESRGCLAPGDGSRLAARIAESLPLDPDIAFQLLHPSHVQNGYVDLGPENRLQVVSPIVRGGAARDDALAESQKITGSAKELTIELKASPDLLGFEISWYAIRPNADGPGFAITPLSAERHVQGRVETGTPSAARYLTLPPQATFYRLVYKADRGGLVTTEILLAARDHKELEHLTEALHQGSTDCGQAGACAIIPRRVAVNPYVMVIVNGRETALPLGAVIGDAIHSAGQSPQAVLPRLALFKLYSGKPVSVEFDRHSTDILRLPLSGGEEISWAGR